MAGQLGDGRRPWRVIVTLLALAFAPAVVQGSSDAGDHVVRTAPADGNIYLAGRSIRLKAPAAADVVAAGGRVTVEETVRGDVLAAGGQVEIRGRVGDDVRVAGGQVRLGGPIANDAIAAGGHVWLLPDAVVGARAWFAGGSIEVDGQVAGDLRAAGGEVTIAGDIAGDAIVHAEILRILPGARIGGRLDYYSPVEAGIAPDATISGAVTHHRSERPPAPTPAKMAWLSRVLVLATLIVTGVVYLLIVPRLAVTAADTLGQRPWASLGLGVAILFAAPPVAVLTMVTMLGMLVGLVILLLYVLMLLFGFLTGVLFAGRVLLRLIGFGDSQSVVPSVFALIAAFLLLAVLGLVPAVGPILVLLALIFGLGALTLRVFGGERGALSGWR